MILGVREDFAEEMAWRMSRNLPCETVPGQEKSMQFSFFVLGDNNLTLQNSLKAEEK